MQYRVNRNERTNRNRARATLTLTAAAWIAFFLAWRAAPAAAQDLVPKAAPQTKPIWVAGATIHPVSGPTIEIGSMLFVDGKIERIVKGAPPPGTVDGTDVVDASGKHLYPGFVCATSVLGLTEVGSVDMTLDTNEAGSVKPEVEAAVALNPDSWLLPVTRLNGVLTCGAMPQGGVVAGRASVIRLDGWTWEDMTLERDAGLCINWPFLGRRSDEDGPRQTLKQLDELFDAADAYLTARKAAPSIRTDLRYEAMASVIHGDKPVFLSATVLRQIETAVEWAVGRNLRPVIVGGRDASLCTDLLKRHDVPVILTSSHRLPRRRDLSYRSTYELPAILEEAGIRWCLTVPASSFASANSRNLPYEAAACIAHGLDEDVALRSVTLSAAECIGVDDRLGTLETGKNATFFLADGDPFELSTTIEAAFIDGRRIDLTDKQTALYEKYREKYRQLGMLGE